MDLLRGAALVAATMTTGLVAGVFDLYAHSIGLGLRPSSKPVHKKSAVNPPEGFPALRLEEGSDSGFFPDPGL
jgi:hypothetical protein